MRHGVLIVDDHAQYRATAREALERQGMAVVGEAYDGDSALEQAVLLQPDLVVLDVHLPEADGFTVAERLGRLPAPPRVVLISGRVIGALEARLAQSRALGFIAKDQLSRATIEALLP